MKKRTLEERLIPRQVVDGMTPCLEWTGKKADGYGQVVVGGHTKRVHRHVWSLGHGDPGSLHVLHRCDNRLCANVDHLFLGTNYDNVQDKMAKGRHGNWGTVATHCKHGHLFDEKNTYRWKGERHCRRCRAGRTAALKARRRVS